MNPFDHDRPATLLASLRRKGVRVTIGMFGLLFDPPLSQEMQSVVEWYEPQIKALLEAEEAANR